MIEEAEATEEESPAVPCTTVEVVDIESSA